MLQVIVDVLGGAVQNVEAPKSVDVEVVDWDNLNSNGREEFAKLSPAGRAYVLKHDPDFQLRYEDNEGGK